MTTYVLRVNGSEHTVDADPEMPLLWAIRDLLDLPGTKYGCGEALCGACTVHLDGEPARSCVTPVRRAVGHAVTTIEGLSSAPGSSSACLSAASARRASS
jgi:isoquinoline 1-oxidoreductase alpha subunit